ncbi:3-isopropylmalate dehydratase small subunit [Methanomassiliicoccus luminyensis]|uniref:3-isopropylmalate dehydratase small subunit n=1 Tax=Methanomassiliicoccus luminyensis TaxID=1080712 RepID=UPI0003651745|nr:3-isopropylmalate dehydratase small subunit [Methanomassiliicoccus luminyensis]
MDAIRGNVWKFADHVDTDQIIPADRLISQNNNCLGDFLFERVRPDLAKNVRKGDIIVAGKNFGCGSSREHAPRSILQAGITCVVAESFARIFYRNSINLGLVLVECKVEASEGDVLSVDVDKGTVRNETTGKSWTFPQYPQYVKDLISSGGLMARLKEAKRCSK